MINARGVARVPALAVAVAVVCGLTAPMALAAPASGQDRQPRAASAKAPKADFNGDGFGDVVVTAPTSRIPGVWETGYVGILYGSGGGKLTDHQHMVYQDMLYVPGSSEYGDRFGSAVTATDLDADGHTDLVVGASHEDIGQTRDTGALYVFWGSPGGLNSAAVLRDGTVAQGQLGEQIAAGDFDGDGDQDVASMEADELRVLSGPFTRAGAPTASTTVATLPDTEVRDLAAGDLNKDGRSDIAATWYRNGDVDEAGTTGVLMGTPQGPGPVTAVGAEPQGGDNVDIGDLDRDGYDDLVVGRSIDGNEGDHTIPTAKGGMVSWIPGSARGPEKSRTRSLNQDSAGVPGTAEDGDFFGRGVSVGDTNGDGYPDISVGVPGEDLGTLKDAGATVVLRGTRTGPTGTGAKVFTQDTQGVPGAAERADHFGSATSLADTDGDGRAELLAAAVDENAGNGSVWVLPDSAAGPTVNGSWTFGAGKLGMPAIRAQLGWTFNE
ncbi:FG-GAP-like repeat-containing protein [Streptomyces sp. NPDC000594]|uniref:FG-GAP-like repeat-containing protein n=1 Tax=Streptomyces sp. NPDC000594 TaxID=3154261 RepID=UPI00331E10B4